MNALARYMLKFRGQDAKKFVIEEPSSLFRVQSFQDMLDRGEPGFKRSELKSMRRKAGKDVMADIEDLLREKGE